jgi:hypothetical protein
MVRKMTAILSVNFEMLLTLYEPHLCINVLPGYFRWNFIEKFTTNTVGGRFALRYHTVEKRKAFISSKREFAPL